MIRKTLLLAVLLLTVRHSIIAQVTQVQEYGPGISARLQHEINMTKDPVLGYVPKDRLVQAYQYRQSRLAASRATLFNWVERGPSSDAVGPSNGNTRPGNGITSGRVRAIWEDLSDPTRKTVWVGGVDGGIWKTTDISANPAAWTPINDFFTNLAIGSICQDPSDFSILYFGTGEKAINADAVRGAGIWRSTDGGNNWNIMPGTENYWNVSKVVCDAAGNLYVACNSISNNQGILRYTKSTGTWTNITPSGLAGRVPDMELSSTGRLHIVCGYYNTASASAGYRYTSNPATVSSATWSSPVTTFPTQYNVALASNGNTLYALPSNSSWQVTAIYKSTDGGANWSVTGSTPSFTSGQAWFCMAVGIDPNNANNVIVGSLDCYKSTNGGSSWTKISNWAGTTGQYVHADQQIILWNSANRVIVGSDGGVHVSTDGGSTFRDKNTGLRIKQFYSVAIHPSSTNYFLGGTQDNGVHQMNYAGMGASVEVTGGDGAFVHIDQDQPQYQWGSYVYNQYRRSTNGGGSWSSINYSSSAGRFINPTDYDDVNNIMYCSGAQNAFVRWNNPQSGTTFSSVTMSGLNTGTVSAVKVSPYTNHTVFFGGGRSGVLPTLIKATNANATPAYTNIISSAMQVSGANISCIELGTDENNILVVFSNYGVNNVWVTSNGGASWTAVDGNLPDMPVRWAMFYPGDNTKAIIATETGIWQTELINGSATVWDPETGFPNVRVDMLQYRASDKTLAAATHGRGLFTTTLTTTASCGTVTGMTSSGITNNAATISWTTLSGANSYDVDYKLNSSTTWMNAATGTTSTSVNLTGLTAGTLYDWRVRAQCAGASGDYATAQFTTAAGSCGNVTGLVSSGITTNSATVSWSGVSGSLSYDVDYKSNSSSTWVNAAAGTTSTSVNLTGLTAATFYDWRVRAHCTDASSTYTQAQFTTQALPCGSVTGLNASNITSSSAALSWSSLNGALNYDVDYKANSSSTWINAAAGTTSTSVNLSGLTGGTLYDWRVRANCNGSTGSYSLAQFTTATASNCPGPYDVSTNGTRSGAATIPFGTDIFGTLSPSGDNDYYKFVTSTRGSFTVSLTNLPADYDLRLFRNNSQVGISQNSGLTAESITYNGNASTYYAQVYGYNGANNASQCYTLRVTLGTATQPDPGVQLHPEKNTTLVLFPNPAKERLTLYLAGYDKLKLIEIFSATGQRVFSTKDADNTASLDISRLSRGLYLVKITAADGRVVAQSRFIKE